MTARPNVPDTPDRTDAIARVLEGIHVSIGYRDDAGDDNWADGTLDMDERRTLIRALLATDDPAAVAALAATLAERHPDAYTEAVLGADGVEALAQRLLRVWRDRSADGVLSSPEEHCRAMARGLLGVERGCSPTCAPHLALFCSPECERGAAER